MNLLSVPPRSVAPASAVPVPDGPISAVDALARIVAGEVSEDPLVRHYARKVLRDLSRASLASPPAGAVPEYIDRGTLLRMANHAFGETVDCDLRGNPITNYDVLLWGAYGPAVSRLVNLALHHEKTAGEQATPG